MFVKKLQIKPVHRENCMRKIFCAVPLLEN